MDDRDLDIIDCTESESSASESSSSVEEGLFKTHIPFVLELHDIRKDDPSMPRLQPIGSPDVGPTQAKIKKHKKKKKSPAAKDTSHTSLSESPSDTSSVAPSAAEVKEEFYDARESYHDMPENKTPIALAASVVGKIKANQNPELTTTSEHITLPDAHSDLSPIIKPTSPP